MFRMTAICFATFALLALINGQAYTAQDGHDHRNRDAQQQGEHAKTEQTPRAGDPYPLLIDPHGDSLADVEKPIIMVQDGRELRFANEENLTMFKADPRKHLSQVDQWIIQQQKPFYPLGACVVSGEKLGEMGDPIDFVYGNRLVRFCCKACVGKFMREPAKYLGMIDAAVVASQKKSYPMGTCVVSGEKLGGAMGEPMDHVMGNRLVRFCCKGCVKMFEKNPAKHLAAIDHLMKHEDRGTGEPYAGEAGGRSPHSHGHDH